MANEEVILDQPGAQTETAVEDVSGQQDSTGTETEQLDTATDESTGEAQQEESYQLPDEQAKVFPFGEIAKFGKNRYGYSEQEIQADPRLQRALHDKLNSDILIAKQLAEQEQTPEIVEEEEPGPTAEETPQQFDPTAWDKQASEYISQNIDHTRAAGMIDGLVATLSKAASPGATAQDKVQAAISLRTMLIDALRTDLPTFLQTAAGGGKSLVDQILSKHEETFNSKYEGFNDYWASTSKERAWEQIKGSDPDFADLPKLGTPEWNAALEQAAEIVPGFENFQFRDPKTKQFVSEHRNFVEKSKILARVLKGKSVEPPQVKQAFETGKKAAVQQQKKAVLAKTFGAGQSTGKTGGTKDSLLEAIERENAGRAFPK